MAWGTGTLYHQVWVLGSSFPCLLVGTPLKSKQGDDMPRGPKGHIKYKEPTQRSFWNCLVLGLLTEDPYVYVIFGPLLFPNLNCSNRGDWPLSLQTTTNGYGSWGGYGGVTLQQKVLACHQKRFFKRTSNGLYLLLAVVSRLSHRAQYYPKPYTAQPRIRTKYQIRLNQGYPEPIWTLFLLEGVLLVVVMEPLAEGPRLQPRFFRPGKG